MNDENDPLGPDALDFWLGTWNVTWTGGGHGTNTIRRVLGSNEGVLFLSARFAFNWRNRILPTEA